MVPPTEWYTWVTTSEGSLHTTLGAPPLTLHRNATDRHLLCGITKPSTLVTNIETTMRLDATLFVVSTLAGIAAAAPLDWENKRALPTPVSAATAKTYLAALTVAAESNSPA
ncbi:hypothetical protein FRC12_012513 [Ceratobasidium sp. 428]|nr:hypothetical protein FRC12_012513 [Ceratobasidium sp. 428]